MSLRVRSWLGALLLLGAVLLGLTGAMGGESLAPLLWVGLGLLVAGIVLIVWAFRSVSRGIGSGQARLEAMLRSEIDAQRSQKREPS